MMRQRERGRVTMTRKMEAKMRRWVHTCWSWWLWWWSWSRWSWPTPGASSHIWRSSIFSFNAASVILGRPGDHHCERIIIVSPDQLRITRGFVSLQWLLHCLSVKKKTRYIVEHLVFPVSGISSSTPSPQPEPISSIAKWNQENQDEKGPRLILWKVVN